MKNFSVLCLLQVHEYGIKKSAVGGNLVDASKDAESLLQEELDKVALSYGGGKGEDMTAFPIFKFTDPKIDTVDLICDENFCRRW